MTERRSSPHDRDRIEEVHLGYRRVANFLYFGGAILGVAVVAALVIGAIALSKVHKEANNRIDSVNSSRLVNTIQSCVADSSKNGVIQQFILFATRGDRQGRLYVKALKVFPVRDRAKCEAEAKGKVPNK